MMVQGQQIRGGAGLRGASFIVGSSLLAGALAAVVSVSLPVQYVSTCQLRQRQDAVPRLESLDLAVGGAAMRAVLADPSIRRRVAAEPGLLQELGLGSGDPGVPEFVRFYEKHVSVAPYTDANAVVVMARHEDPRMAARLANLAADAGRALFAERLAERQSARSAERKAKIEALEARAGDVEARFKSRPPGSTTFRLEAEMKILLEKIEDLRYEDRTPVSEPDPWFVESRAQPGQYRETSMRWAAVLACALFAAAFAALVWLARDAEPAR